MTNGNSIGGDVRRPVIRPAPSGLSGLLSPLDMVAIGLMIAMTLWPLVMGMALAPSREEVATGRITPDVARSGAPLHDTGAANRAP